MGRGCCYRAESLLHGQARLFRMKTDRAIERYNRVLRTELGSQPRYEWKWSEDLIHLMEEVDHLGKPVLEEVCVNGIFGMQQRKKPRKFFESLTDQWVVCALIEMDNADGQVNETGQAAWIP